MPTATLTTVHVVSSASHPEGGAYAMCGTLLAPYRAATAEGHVVGNYASPALVAERVTCTPCADAMRAVFTRSYGIPVGHYAGV